MKPLSNPPKRGSPGIKATSAPIEMPNKSFPHHHPFRNLISPTSIVPLLPKDRDDDRQAHGHFRRRQRDDEKRQRLPVRRPSVAREGDEGQVGGVEHELDRHEDDQGVPRQTTPVTPMEKRIALSVM
jgi:hypothetical protein